MKIEIIKQTEKAVAIENEEFTEAREVARYDLKELTREQTELLRNGASLIWLPKSQIKIENGFVVSMPDWLARKHHLSMFTEVEINGRKFAKEILVKNSQMLAELGVTAEQVLAM